MSRGAHNGTGSRILEMLSRGQATCADIYLALDISASHCSGNLRWLLKATKTIPKRIYVARWVYEQEGQRSYPRAVYAIGDKPDVQRPNPQGERMKCVRAKIRQGVIAGSIFALGDAIGRENSRRAREKA